MRAVSALPSVGLALFLFGCNPPLPENEAPSIRVVEPVGRLDEDSGVTTYRANALNPLLLRLVLRDRDGDSPLDVRVYLDPTPDTAGDPVETMDEVGSALGLEVADLTGTLEDLYPGEDNRPDLDRITEGAIVDITLSEGLAEGTQALVIVATDNQEVDAARELRLDFAVNASLSAPGVAVSPTSPRTGDPVVGTLTTPSVDPDGGEPYHEWRWTHTITDEQVPPDAPGTGTTGTLPAVSTTKGDVWRFCFTAWDTGDGTEPSEAERATVPRVEGCQEVTIVNSPPGSPGAVDLDPASPSPATPLLCSVITDATDPDGDPITYSFTWLRDGVTVPGVTGPWLPALFTAETEDWTCEALASDTEVGGSQTSLVVEIGVRQVALEDAQDKSIVGTTAGDRVGADLASVGIENLDGFVVGVSERDIAKAYRALALPTGGNIDSAGLGLTATEPGVGRSVASADLDGDGRLELILGAEGAAWVVFGDSVTGATNLDTAAVASIGSADPEFGAVVAAGELRSASLGGEVVVASASVAAPNVVRVYNGNAILPLASLLDTNDNATITASAVGDGFGSVLAIGDITGDGNGDLVVSDPISDIVYIFPGDLLTGDLTPTSPGVISITGTAGDELGAALVVGDFDGDGTDDLAIGAPGADVVGVFYGGPTLIGGTFPGDADARLDGAGSSRFGASLGRFADTTDLTGDALVVAAPTSANGSLGIFLGETLVSGSGPLEFADASAVYTGTGSGNGLRTAASFVNLDNDVIPDLLFAEADQDGVPGADIGKVYVILTNP